MKIPRDREVKCQKNSREILRNETLAGYCFIYRLLTKYILSKLRILELPCKCQPFTVFHLYWRNKNEFSTKARNSPLFSRPRASCNPLTLISHSLKMNPKPPKNPSFTHPPPHSLRTFSSEKLLKAKVLLATL